MSDDEHAAATLRELHERASPPLLSPTGEIPF